MTERRVQLALRNIRALVTAQNSGHLSDHELLQRFVQRQDELAFVTLLRRHGPMVLRVCRRILHDWHLAEDAFQATFLVLARRADSIWPGVPVNCWLHSVAQRVALRARSRTRPGSRSAPLPEVLAGVDPSEEMSLRELRPVLDQELQRLPEKYRAPLLLCYLEGKTRDEATQQLGWPLGTLKKRLERGRELLRVRLVRRGLALSSFLLSTLLADNASATVPAELLTTTVQAALPFAADPTAAPAGISAGAVALAQGVLNTMIASKTKLAAVLLLAVTLLGTGAGVLLHVSSAADRQPAAALAAPGKEPVRKDLHGDPLPAGARALLGSTRWRQGSVVKFVVYTPDGKHVITANYEGSIRKIEAASGKEVLQLEKGMGNFARGGPDVRCRIAALSPHGKTLAVITYANMLNLYDVGTGKQVRQIRCGAVFGLTFAPDSKSVMTGTMQGRLVTQWDVASGKEMRKFGEAVKVKGFENPACSLVVAPTGKVLVSAGFEHDGGNIKGASVRRWEAETGKALSPAKGGPGKVIVLAPDGKSAAWGDWRNAPIRLWDLENDKEIRQFDGHGMPAVFSPDSKLMAGLDADRLLCLWDVQTGKVLHKLGTAGSGPTPGGMAFSADSKQLIAGVDTLVRQWDVSNGKEVCLAAGHTGSVSALAISADGKTVFSRGDDYTFRAWEASTGKQLRRAVLPPTLHAVFAPNGRVLVLGGAGHIHIWDTQEGKELREWKGPEKGLGGLAVSPDGKTVAARGEDQTIRLYDTATGNELRQMADPIAAAGALGGPQGGGGGAIDSANLALAFSADGAVLATLPRGSLSRGYNGRDMVNFPQQTDNGIRLWDVARGKLMRKLDDANKSTMIAAAFASHGRIIATSHADSSMTLFEAATGKERFRFQAGSKILIRALAFCADGKVIIGGCSDGAVRFWDAGTGKELAQRQGHQGSVLSLVLTSDGKTLVSGSSDMTGMVWDMPQLETAKPKPAALSAAKADELWKDLADAAPARAYEAIRTLSEAPAQAIPLLGERLKPVAGPTQERLDKLIADMESPQFATRQKAEDELEKLGELAEPALKKLLAGKPNLDTKQRADKLLDKMVTVQAPRPELLQVLRALAVLEEVGSPEARQVLEKLAAGAGGAQVTRQAQAALRRLSR